MLSRLDVRTHAGGDATLTPSRLASWGSSLLDTLKTPERTPSFLADRLDKTLRKARKSVQRTRRDLNRLDSMLDQYQPFIHDHDWVFDSTHTEAAIGRLHADDEAFADDLSTMCWRHYWMEVQYPGVARWSFPIMDGNTVDEDAPSCPPLELGRSALLADQGAA